MGKESKDIGEIGEGIVAEYLSSKGWFILERNFRSSHGEIDIIAKDRQFLVFVEVKNYSFRSIGKPMFSITVPKKRCIIHAARTYLQYKKIQDMFCRFDVVAIYRDENDIENIEHIENAFEIN